MAGEGFTNLAVGQGAFRQKAYGENTLASVEFPEGLVSLTIGEGAFQQQALGVRLNNALTGVVFQRAWRL